MRPSLSDLEWHAVTALALGGLLASPACHSSKGGSATSSSGAGGTASTSAASQSSSGSSESSASGAGGASTSTSNSASGTGGGDAGGPDSDAAPTNVSTCSDLIAGSSWSTTLTAADFVSAPSYAAYQALNTCACQTKVSAGGCEDACSQPQNGTTTNDFCNGVAALSKCQFCLDGAGSGTGKANCTMPFDTCLGN